jgi:hypothetical protein
MDIFDFIDNDEYILDEKRPAFSQYIACRSQAIVDPARRDIRSSGNGTESASI